MMNTIAEKDWKLLRKMKDEKLNIACETILAKINTVINNKGIENYKAYLNVCEIVDAEDKKIAEMFNDLKRSNAVIKLALWKRNGLLTESELGEFSPETRSTIEAICEF